ncbi:MAG TPA: Uma2 family endonuclease [Isosphaeraceae bacterium]|nr:Uma2 family endonuclease [Isosphaeraceae bacterium]
MATATGRVGYSPEDLLVLGDDAGVELVGGHLLEKPPMGAKANLIGSTLLTLLNIFVRANRLGLCFGENCGYQVFEDDASRVRKPDVSFVRTGRLPGDVPPDGFMRIRPDLAVEVVSPNDLAEDIDERIHDFLRVGVPLVWVVYPKTRTALVLRPDGTARRLVGADALDGEAVLPGFSCPLAELFAGL